MRILDRRTLNRTLLSRQGLLRRMRRPVRDVVEHLTGLQAQEPQNPFTALWARVDGFDPAELDALIAGRRAVRTALMRTTLHLVTAEDALALQPLFAPVLARTLRSQRAFRIGLEGLDLGDVAAVGARHLGDRPMSARDLRPILARAWPDRDPAHLMAAIRYLVPVVQVPPRGLFRRTRQPELTTVRSWLGQDPAAEADIPGLIRRYLRAFGPASTSDMRTWSWITGLAPVVATMRDELRAYRDERGRELLDVPDGEIVDGDVPAPVRFLPEFDNAFLSHADRSRIVEGPLELERYARGTLLVDGFACGGWWMEAAHDEARLHVLPARRLTRAELTEVESEGDRLAAFLAPDAESPTVELHPSP